MGSGGVNNRKSHARMAGGSFHTCPSLTEKEEIERRRPKAECPMPHAHENACTQTVTLFPVTIRQNSRANGDRRSETQLILLFHILLFLQRKCHVTHAQSTSFVAALQSEYSLERMGRQSSTYMSMPRMGCHHMKNWSV